MQKRAKTTCLIGDPGSGKSRMASTALRKPVHFYDIDRKLLSAAWAEPLLLSGDITVKELEEPVDASSIGNRLRAMIAKKRPPTQPQGWVQFGEYFNAHDDPNWIAAGTVVVDSLTLLNEHLKTFISYAADKPKFQFDQWNALKSTWMDTMSTLRDLHREQDKDLIVTVHERSKTEPGERVHGAMTERAVGGSGEVSYQTIYQGQMDVEVWASIDGAFGNLIGAQMDEYYRLYVEMEGDTPIWKCRVQPDGKRNLRTSFNVNKPVFNPDFKEIWK